MNDTITIAALLGFDEHPCECHEQDIPWLVANSIESWYAATPADLPDTDDEMCWCIVQLDVPTDSAEAKAARANTRFVETRTDAA